MPKGGEICTALGRQGAPADASVLKEHASCIHFLPDDRVEITVRLYSQLASLE
jgi:hypothetical protein